MENSRCNPEERRAAILQAAGALFKQQGYRSTPVDAIVKRAGVAKGTFYYYFPTKEALLEALVHGLISHMVQEVSRVLEAPGLNGLQKFQLIVERQRALLQAADVQLMDELHLPENRDLHERVNIETVHLFAPLLAKAVAEGQAQGLFAVQRPLEVLQFILAGSQFLLDRNHFEWDAEEEAARLAALQEMMEKSLGAASGSLAFIVNLSDRSKDV